MTALPCLCRLVPLLVLVTVARLPATADGQATAPVATLRLKFDDGGLAALDGTPGLALRSGRIDLLDLKGPALPPRPFDVVVRHFHREACTLRQRFTWGEIGCAYAAPTPNRLDVSVTVTNATAGPLTRSSVSLMEWGLDPLPDGPAFAQQWPIACDPAEDGPLIALHSSAVSVAMCVTSADESPPPLLGLLTQAGTDARRLTLTFAGDAAVPAGKTRACRVSIRVGPPTVAPSALAADALTTDRARWPARLSWADRRPIGVAHLSTSAAGFAHNPRGWFLDAQLDVTTPAGRAAFAHRVDDYAAACIKIARGMDAQGVIVWDIEGQEFPHAISYVGDPRLLPTLAPEMDAAADGLFARLRAAGLRVGVCVRPTRMTPVAPGDAPDAVPWAQRDVEDAVVEMAAKIRYAKQRWGCTLIYADSTVLHVPRPDGTVDTIPMPASMLARLAAMFPDTLIIPEQETPRCWAYTAPYNELRQGISATPPLVRAMYPRSFSVLQVNDAGDLKKWRRDLVAAVRAGDVLLFRTWFDDPDNAAIRAIYREAAEAAAEKLVP